jgi:hypothetical protein
LNSIYQNGNIPYPYLSACSLFSSMEEEFGNVDIERNINRVYEHALRLTIDPSQNETNLFYVS